MSKQIRNLGVFFMVCYLALFAQLHRFAVGESDDLRDDPRNRRAAERQFNAPRGNVVTFDGVLLAETVEEPDGDGVDGDGEPDAEPGGEDDDEDDRSDRRRVYPEGELFGHVTGYFGQFGGIVQTSGIEESYDDELRGRNLGFDLDPGSIFDHFFDSERVGNLTLTMRHDVQSRARELLDDRLGSAVVLDPRTGAIIAMYSNPTYDPNALSVPDPVEALARFDELNDREQHPRRPLVGRTYQDRFFPGSTFKVVTAAAGLASGEVTPDTPVYPSDRCYQPPHTGNCIYNYGNHECGGDLLVILARSCNTSFMQMAVDQVGSELMVETAEAFGFNAEVPLDLPGAVRSHFPDAEDFRNAQAFLALSSIGQYEVAASPLEMALVAATVANEGRVPTPHVVHEVRDNEERLVRRYDPDPWLTAMDRQDAAVLYDAMVNVVENGTAENMRLDGYVVGGKTGTAQLDDSRTRSHAWIIGFAGPEGEIPTVAVAVLVEAQEGASEQTGGSVAAPIARDLMAMALGPPAQSE